MDEEKDLTPEEALSTAYAAAPPYIQEFVISGKFEAFMVALQSRLGLHADVAAKVSDEILFMVLGMSPPAQFPENLRNEAGVQDELIPVIIDETNKGIFVPLGEVTRKNQVDAAPAINTKPVQPAPTPAPATPVVPKPSVVVTPVVVVPPPAKPPVSTLPAEPAPHELTLTIAPKPMTISSKPSAFPTRTMATDVELTKVPVPIVKPEPVVVTAPVVPAAPTEQGAETIADDLKQYGIDPYREKPE